MIAIKIKNKICNKKINKSIKKNIENCKNQNNINNNMIYTSLKFVSLILTIDQIF